MNNVAIDLLGTQHLPDISRVHIAAFPESAMTLLGKEVVKRYYDWQMTGPHDAIAIGSFLHNELVGFLFGGFFRSATTGFLQKNRFYLTMRVLLNPRLIANPLFRDRLNLSVNLLNRLSQQKKKGVSGERLVIRSFGILAIAVDPTYQNLGIGKKLMEEAEHVALDQKYQVMHLTVHPDNITAIRFYEKLGWERHITQSDWQGSMRKFLKNPSSVDL